MLVKVIKFGKGLTIMTVVGFVVVTSIILFERMFYINKDWFIWGILGGLSVTFLLYPVIFRYYTSKVFLGLYNECLVIQDNNMGLKVINWEAVKAYKIEPFDSLSGSGFTLKIYQRNKVIIRISFIGINLSDSYHIADSNSLIFNLIQQINAYNNTHPLVAKRIQLILTRSRLKVLIGMSSFFVVLIGFGLYLTDSNQPIPSAYWICILAIIIIGSNFYIQNRLETVINNKLSQLHFTDTIQP